MMWTRISCVGRVFLEATKTSFGAALVLTALGTVAMALETDPPSTPEIDAGSAASAIALLAGGVMLLKDRFRAK
jgi:hypothetical protein